MSRAEYVHLLAERTAIERMIAETPVDEVIDRASLVARLERISAAIESTSEQREPAHVRLTFKGRPVVGSHGVFAEFGAKAVNSFTESVAAMAASLAGPLAAMGPIPNRDQHQLLITRTALGSFGFELEEPPTNPLVGDVSPIAQALERTQSVLRGTLGTDDDLADSAAEVDRRALDKVRTFLETLADHEAVCTVQLGESIVSFADVGQVRVSIERLSRENLREEIEELDGELQGVLPRARAFEFKLGDTGLVIRGKVAPTIQDPDELNRRLHQRIRIKVMVTRVGNGRPRYLLVESP